MFGQLGSLQAPRWRRSLCRKCERKWSWPCSRGITNRACRPWRSQKSCSRTWRLGFRRHGPSAAEPSSDFTIMWCVRLQYPRNGLWEKSTNDDRSRQQSNTQIVLETFGSEARSPFDRLGIDVPPVAEYRRTAPIVPTSFPLIRRF